MLWRVRSSRDSVDMISQTTYGKRREKKYNNGDTMVFGTTTGGRSVPPRGLCGAAGVA